jgi:hypothetical protein
MKEPLCIGAISLIIWGIIQHNKEIGNKWSVWAVVIINSYILVTVKAYIFYSFIGGLLLALLITWFYKIPLIEKNAFVRRFISIVLLFLIIGTFFFLSGNLTSNAAQLIISEIANTQTAQIQASLDAGGSGYTLSELNPTPYGIFTFSLSAIITSFFRPWIWEINKPVLILNAFEAFGTLVFTFWMIFTIGAGRFFTNLFKSLLPATFIFFAIFMSIVIGIISFNFGTLVRYKAPMLGFYFLAFLLIYMNTGKTSSSKTSENLASE